MAHGSLSEVLSLLKPRSTISAGFDAGGQWSVQFPDQQKRIKCYAVVSGGCWLSVDGVPDAVRLRTGDCFVLPSGRPFRLASDMRLEPVHASTIFPPERAGGVVTLNGGGDFFCVGSRFAVSGSHANILMGMLPPVVHIRNESDQAALRWPVERMRHELREQQPGSFLVAEHLAHMMLIQALRMYLAEAPNGGSGWLAALADKQQGVAISAMHSEPARRWTLQELAERCCMSRSAFAQKFKDAVGVAPMEYLVRWRMLLAADRLENSSEPVSAIALSLGYESESAFSTAFKREMGDSPRRYGRERRRASTPNGKPARQGLAVSALMDRRASASEPAARSEAKQVGQRAVFRGALRANFVEAHPGVQLEVTLTDEKFDIVVGGWKTRVRLGTSSRQDRVPCRFQAITVSWLRGALCCLARYPTGEACQGVRRHRRVKADWLGQIETQRLLRVSLAELHRVVSIVPNGRVTALSRGLTAP